MVAKDTSIVKSYRTSEEQFASVDGICKKAGFSVTELIRLTFECTIREGRIPRFLTNTKEAEERVDESRSRESYIDGLLDMALPSDGNSTSAEERLFKAIFGEESSENMSNSDLRIWADRWGLPDELSASTLADLHDCGLFSDNPWFGDYDYDSPADDDIYESDPNLLHLYRENLRDNLEKVKKTLDVKAYKVLMEIDN